MEACNGEFTRSVLGTMKIGIILPTRGFLFTEVLEGIEKNRKGYETKLFTSSNLPIPEAQNTLINQALADHFITHL